MFIVESLKVGIEDEKISRNTTDVGVATITKSSKRRFPSASRDFKVAPSKFVKFEV
jgi:hypothetical protein